MPLDINIKNAGTNNKAYVDKGGKLRVQSSNIPQNGQKMLQEPFRAFFTNSCDSNDMRVDGSCTAIDFNISSHATYDTYIKTFTFELTDVGNGDLNEFANTGAALTNGVSIALKQDIGDITLHEGIKTNYQLMQYGGFRPAFGNTTNTFRASNVNGSSEGWSSFVDLNEIYGLVYGIRIPANTTTTLTVSINDNLSSGLTTFNCVASGFLRLNEPLIQEI